MNKYDNISDMTLEERTAQYTARRSAELRGGRLPLLMDERTRTYITRYFASLRGDVPEKTPHREHPYITRRLAELRSKSK